MHRASCSVGCRCCAVACGCCLFFPLCPRGVRSSVVSLHSCWSLVLGCVLLCVPCPCVSLLSSPSVCSPLRFLPDPTVPSVDSQQQRQRREREKGTEKQPRSLPDCSLARHRLPVVLPFVLAPEWCGVPPPSLETGAGHATERGEERRGGHDDEHSRQTHAVRSHTDTLASLPQPSRQP